MEWYYKSTHADYWPLPPYRPDCLALLPGAGPAALTLLYPPANGNIYVPTELDGSQG